MGCLGETGNQIKLGRLVLQELNVYKLTGSFYVWSQKVNLEIDR